MPEGYIQPESKALLTWVPELGRPAAPTQAAQVPGRGPSGLQTLTYGPDLAKNRAWAVATDLGSGGPSGSGLSEGHWLLCLQATLSRAGSTQQGQTQSIESFQGPGILGVWRP